MKALLIMSSVILRVRVRFSQRGNGPSDFDRRGPGAIVLRTTVPRLKWAKAIGVVSALPCAYFWVGVAAALFGKIRLPYSPGRALLSIALSVPASIWAAVRWDRRMYAAAAVAVLTIVLIMLSLG